MMFLEEHEIVTIGSWLGPIQSRKCINDEWFSVAAQCTFTATSNGNISRDNPWLTRHFACTGFLARAASVKSALANLECRVKCTRAKSWKRNASRNEKASPWYSVRSWFCKKSIHSLSSIWLTLSRQRILFVSCLQLWLVVIWNFTFTTWVEIRVLAKVALNSTPPRSFWASIICIQTASFTGTVSVSGKYVSFIKFIL